MKNLKTAAMIFPKSLILLVIGLTYFTGLHASPEDVDLAGPNPNSDFPFNFGMEAIPAGTGFGVTGALGNVFWEFNSIPGTATGITSTTFTVNGVTVTIPNTSGGAASSALTATFAGTPIIAGSFTFIVTVSDESDPASRTRNRAYEIVFTPDADLVLVLDRSGSMTANTSAGITRWEALKEATANFLLILSGLGRTGDNIGLSYFHSSVTQPSGDTFPTPLIPFVANTGSLINSELNTHSPSGNTAMGAGLKDGQGKVTDNSRVRFLILFTDGEQNMSPLVNSNGQGYSDGSPLNSSYPAGLKSIKVFTIGIASPNGPDLNTLQSLAGANRGNYVATDDGALDEAFTDQLLNSFGSLSPQLIARSSTSIDNSDEIIDLQSFPLNKKVSRLLIKISADRRFETPQLLQLASSIVLEKDGVPIQRGVQPSWIGNYSKTVLLTLPFDETLQNGIPVITPEGEWTIKIRRTSSLDISEVKITSIADDHRLDYSYSNGDTSPRVNSQLNPSLTLSWLGEPVTDAIVQAVVLRPGDDLGDALAKNPLVVKVSTDPDAPSAGVQKYNQLYATDSAFKNSLAYNENVITLTHTADGKYEGTFDGLTVAGNYQIVYRISGDNEKTGKYQRSATESIFVSFNGVDLDASNLSATLSDKSMVLNITPVTSNGKLVGPAYGKGFTIDNPNIKIDAVEDHQDGSYTISFSGNVDEAVSFGLIGQEIYAGDLDSIGGSDSIIDKMQDWLESMGLPAWTLWLILFILLLLIIVRLASKKN